MAPVANADVRVGNLQRSAWNDRAAAAVARGLDEIGRSAIIAGSTEHLPENPPKPKFRDYLQNRLREWSGRVSRHCSYPSSQLFVPLFAKPSTTMTADDSSRKHSGKAGSEPGKDEAENAAARLRARWDIAGVAAGLTAARDDWRAVHREHAERHDARFPSRQRLELILSDLSGTLFPLRLGPSSVTQNGESAYVLTALDRALSQLHGQIDLELRYIHRNDDRRRDQEAADIVGDFAASLPPLRRLLDTDVEAAYAGDPAARSVDEVLLCYPGLHAMIFHRIAHRLHELGVPLIARIIAELAHSQTGIDIHPGAQIGHSFFIDHGTGIVIGETAVIGNRVRLYQAVTLGARSFPLGDDGTLAKGLPRHPIVEDDVVIYAGATILGRVTIGARSVIGGGVWLTESVIAGSVISQARVDRERASVPTIPNR